MDYFETTDFSDDSLALESAIKDYQDDSEKNTTISLGDQLKRGFDFFASLIAFIVFLLPGLVIALLIFMEDGKNPLFRQKRVGKDGRSFTLLKFRSMRMDSEENGIPALCSEHDDRLTKVGAFIRRHHLDELPQILNVIAGDMSFVGYRPERAYFIKKIMEHDERYARLFAIRPGLFSEATLYNGYTDTMEKMLTRLEMDLDYLRRRSLWLDITIIYKTTISIITGKKF